MMTSEYQHLSPRIDLAFLASLPLFAHVPSELLVSILAEDTVRLPLALIWAGRSCRDWGYANIVILFALDSP